MRLHEQRMSKGLGEFEQLLLFAILRLGPERAYGARIRREIETRTGRDVSPGAVYTALDRLQSRGLVSSREGDATPMRGGRRKKLYDLEAAGAAALHESWSGVWRMAEGVLDELHARAAPPGDGGR
jgi:DNA-binding PadR family transcriptional regulator